MTSDFGNIKMNLDGIHAFLKDSNFKLTNEETDKINSIFNECDTTNAQGENKADGELTGAERDNFMNRIQSYSKFLYDKVVDYYTLVDVAEGLKEEKAIKEAAQNQETLKMNLDGFHKFLTDNGVKLTDTEKAKVDSMFKECDEINGNPDGELTGVEKEKFMNRIKSYSKLLYSNLENYYTLMDVSEDLNAEKAVKEAAENVNAEKND